MKRILSWFGLILISLVLIVGCSNQEKSSGGDPTKTELATSADSPAKKQIKDEAVAFMYGVHYADACIWAALDDPAKMKSSLASAKTLAAALGVPAPAAPTKENAIKLMDGEALIADLKAKKGEKITALFCLGAHSKMASFGSALGTDFSPELETIRKIALVAEIPESVWKAELEALKTSPKGGFDKLIKGLKNYLTNK
jgi:hypothetical protein